MPSQTALVLTERGDSHAERVHLPACRTRDHVVCPETLAALVQLHLLSHFARFPGGNPLRACACRWSLSETAERPRGGRR